MIRYAKKEDLPILKKLWDEYFGFDGLEFNEFFFKYIYPDVKQYLLTQEDEIVSIASTIPQTIILNKKLLKTSLICGVLTLEKFQGQGKMRKLMELILDHLSHQELVTLIEAYNPTIYQSFGFELVYTRRKYFVDKRFKCSLKQCLEFNPRDLLKVYAGFMKHFNAYKVRSIKDFQLILKQVEYESNIVVVNDEKGEISGYAIYQLKDDIAFIEEIIYLNKKSFESLLALIQTQALKLELNVSNNERFDRIYGFNFIDYGYGLARINDYELFNRLYKKDIKSAKEAFGKALWYREDF